MAGTGKLSKGPKFAGCGGTDNVEGGGRESDDNAAIDDDVDDTVSSEPRLSVRARQGGGRGEEARGC